MAVPIRHKNILKTYVDDATQAVWARDLVSLAIQTGGLLTDAEQSQILDELLNNAASPTVPLPMAFIVNDPTVRILRLVHKHGVNALADNQEIVFCEEGITLLYGRNRSGKSGYFRILNQMAGGEINQTLHQNVYVAAPQSIEVVIEYSVDGTTSPAFTWNGVAAAPADVRHLRFFDSQYAQNYLSSRGGNTYFFKSQNLMVFKAINDTLDFMKELGTTIDANVEAGLRGLCSTTYKDALTRALIDAFQEELRELGMEDLKVALNVENLLNDDAEIAITLTNSMAIDGILSEAELKCAALALFLAECSLTGGTQPIVLDDPVNSLDDILIERFAHRLSKMQNQIIVFTHNVLFKEALTDERCFKVYRDPATSRAGTRTTKKHVLAYDVLTSGYAFGYILGDTNRRTKFYLDRAQDKLSATPVTDEKGIVDDLRMAVEWAIDEVVFRGLAPRRFKGSELTDWGQMELMTGVGAANVKELHDIYNQLSGLGSHLGYSSYVLSATVSRLQALHTRIETVFSSI